jgi:hypothetical protein
MGIDTPRDRPTDEDRIELTQKMQDAGFEVLRLYDPQYDDITPTVREIFLAMWRARDATKTPGS